MAESSGPKRNKIINRIEPSAQLFFIEYEDYVEKFEQFVWLVFDQKLQRHDANVTLAFAQVFDGKTTMIGDMTMEVTKDSIAAATRLLQSAERWFKNKPVKAIDYNLFLVDAHQNPNCSKGIPRRWVRLRS